MFSESYILLGKLTHNQLLPPKERGSTAVLRPPSTFIIPLLLPTMLRSVSRLSALTRTFNPRSITSPLRPLPAMSAHMSSITAKDACPRM